jgi:hypothetical protein
MIGDCQNDDPPGGDAPSVSVRSSRIRAARPPHANAVSDAGKLVSLNVGLCAAMVSKAAPKATRKRRGGTADAFRSRREASRCPGTKRTRYNDGKAGRKEKEKARANASRPDAGRTVTATRDDAAMPGAVPWYRRRAVAVPPADGAGDASNRD